MRHETQPWPFLRVTLEQVFGGVPFTGSVTAQAGIFRISDGQYWDGAAWQGAPAFVAMPESPISGVYAVAVPPADVDYEAGKEGYIVRVTDTTTGILESVKIDQGPRPWQDLQSDFTDADTFGDRFARMVALRQRNMRFTPSAWDPVTSQPTAGTITIYATRANALADINAIGEYSVQATFNGSGQLTEYVSVEDS
jgi:hypothetical protein